MRILLDHKHSRHAQRDNDLTCYYSKSSTLLGGKHSLPREIIDEIEGRKEKAVNRFEGDLGGKALRGVSSAQKSPSHVFDDTVQLLFRGKAKHEEYPARANIVCCGKGAYYSATFRILERDSPEKRQIRFKQWPTWADPKHTTPSRILADFVFDRVTNQGTELTGAIIVAGSTGSGKSVFAREVALSAIRGAIPSPSSKEPRFPHLVTYEDPIEDWKIPDENGVKVDLQDPEVSAGYGFCLTARQKGIDVRSLESALLDAKRQTPTCVFIGELRKAAEWKKVMEFAGSGHLIVVTTHAASVTEAMSRVLNACGAKTSAARRQWAGFLRGVVHLEKKPSSAGKVVLPSLWRGRSSARSALVSTGLASIVPNSQFMDSRLQFLNDLVESKLWMALPWHQRNIKRQAEFIREVARDLDTKDLLR